MSDINARFKRKKVVRSVYAFRTEDMDAIHKWRHKFPKPPSMSEIIRVALEEFCEKRNINLGWQK